jgi:hypothetical protein
LRVDLEPHLGVDLEPHLKKQSGPEVKSRKAKAIAVEIVLLLLRERRERKWGGRFGGVGRACRT